MFQHQQANKAQGKSVLFQQHLEVYNFPAFGGGDHQDFVIHHLLNTPSVTDTSLVLPPSHQPENDGNVLQSLYHTIPVYWGGAKDEMINWEAVGRNFGYGKADTQMTNEATSNTRYAIIGQVKVMANGPDQPEWDAYVCHIWAANFESNLTADYQTMIAPHYQGGTINRAGLLRIQEACYGRHFEMLKLSIDSALLKTSGENLHIQSALNGAGCFLKGLTPELREVVLQIQVRATRDVIASYAREDGSAPFTFKMAIYSPGDFPDSIVAGYLKLADGFRYFTVGVGRDAGNVLGHLDRTKTNVIINAGDPKSGKGNGMSKDFTVEGFIVANAGGFNNGFRNTSFLHNARFNPELADPAKWVRTQ